MLDTAPPKIYVSKVPDAETTSIPSDAVELTSGVDGYIVNNDIEGLARPDAEIARSTLAGADASRISGRQIPYRNIVLDIIPMPEINTNRERLYNILPYGETLRFYFEKWGKVVFIDGQIEKMDGSFAPGKPFRFGVSIICPFPWLQSVKLHTVQLKAGDNIIRNDGDIPAGFRLEVEGHINMVGLIDFKLNVGGETFATKADTNVIAPVELITIPGKRTFKCSNGGHISTSTWKPSFSYLAANTKWPKIPGGTQIINVSYTEGGVDPYIFDNLNTLYWRDTYSGV